MFKVGDVIVGTSEAHYSHTGPGSVCIVKRVREDTHSIDVVVQKGAPDREALGMTFSVDARFFRLQKAEEIKPIKQTIEELKTFYCCYLLGSGDPCDEIADRRITIPGLSLTLCKVHAQPYVKGTSKLEALKCELDGNVCQPGHAHDRDYRKNFCDEECRDKWLEKVHRGDRVPAY